MNEHLQTCQSLAEAVSLLAAGCLTPDEEIEAQQHLATCSACRERFKQLDSVCIGLHAARPEERLSAAEAVVARALAEIGASATLVGDHVMSRSRSKSRWRLVAVSAIAASLLAVVSWQSFSFVTQQSSDVVHYTPPKVIPASGQESGTAVARTTAAVERPTLLALQRAAARSDEAFDDLLCGNEVVYFSPLDAPSLLLETDR